MLIWKIRWTYPKIFISYSSKIQLSCKDLGHIFIPLKMENKITDWTDCMIKTGTSWNEKIQKELDESDHIIYLLSPDFLATPYIMDVELKKD